MSDKENISATVDPDIASYLSKDDINASGLINKLLKQHIDGGTTEEQMLQFRIRQVESEIESLEGRLESKRNELDELQSRYDNVREDKEDTIQRAAEVLSHEDLDEQNQKVEYWAGEVNMSVESFVDLLRDRLDDRDNIR